MADDDNLSGLARALDSDGSAMLLRGRGNGRTEEEAGAGAVGRRGPQRPVQVSVNTIFTTPAFLS